MHGLTLRELLPWHQTVRRQLLTYVKVDRVPHALLISGKNGVGKGHLARQLAKWLLCGKQDAAVVGCGRCASCQLFDAHTHPDYYRVGPSEPDKPITIDAIRALCEALALKPQYSGYRVVLMEPAHRMNAAASNSLLKTLEEPAERTVIILLSDLASALPATILSRCQHITIGTPDRATALDWLCHHQLVDQADVFLALSGDAPLHALELFRENSLTQRNSVFEAWISVSEGDRNPVELAEEWSTLPCGQLLVWTTGWIIDMIRLYYGAASTTGLYNPDLRDRLQAEVQKLNLKQLFRLLDLTFTSKQLIDSQANKQLLLETVLIEWHRLARPG